MSNPQPSSSRRARVLLAAVPLILAGLLASAASASAATIDYASGTLTITGAAGEDDLLVSYGGGWSEDPTKVQIKSWNGGGLGSGAASVCVDGDEPDLWECPTPAKIVVTLGAGEDYLTVYEDSSTPFTVPFEVDGGPDADRIWTGAGNDTISGGAGNDALNGGAGNDVIRAGDGDDVLTGRLGNDVLDGGAGNDSLEDSAAAPFGAADLDAGADTYTGGPGSDRFSYFGRSAAVQVSLDGKANDGESGEGDNVAADIEEVGGGSGDDVLTGSAGADHLWGSDGDDRISGGGGNDRLQGDGGDDRLDGGAGNDELDGGCMTDTLVGGAGADSFLSDGTCGPELRSPLDRIEANDGERDALIFCQRDTDRAGDTAVVDPVDPVTKSGPGACKTVVVDDSGGSGGPGSGKVLAKLGKGLKLMGGGSASPQADLKRRRLVLGTLVAAKTSKVSVTAKTRAGKVVKLGRAKLKVKAGSSKKLQVKFSSKAKRAIEAKKSINVNATFKVGKATYKKKIKAKVKG